MVQLPQQLVRPPALRMVRCGELSLRQCRHEKYFRLRKLFCLWKMHLCHRSSKCSHLRKPRRPWRTYHRRRSRTRRRAQCPQSGPGRPRASCIAALAPMRPSSTSTPAVWLAGLPTAVTRLTCTAVTANCCPEEHSGQKQQRHQGVQHCLPRAVAQCHQRQSSWLQRLHQFLPLWDPSIQ